MILAAIALTALVVAALRAKVPCDHRLYAHIDNRTGRIYDACRCGERWQP
jgi:hypothetical protein